LVFLPKWGICGVSHGKESNHLDVGKKIVLSENAEKSYWQVSEDVSKCGFVFHISIKCYWSD